VQAQNAKAETMAAHQARMDAAHAAAFRAQQAAAQAQLDADRASAAAGAPAPSSPASAVSHEAQRAMLKIPGLAKTTAALSTAQDGVILRNGEFELRWQRDGNLVVYRNGDQPTWASGAQGWGTRLSWQPDGNLVIYAGNDAVWATGTADSQQGGRGGKLLRLNQQGHLVIRNDTGVIWRSNAVAGPKAIPSTVAIAELQTPGNPDQVVAELNKSQNGVILKNGAFELHWQGDGNLVVYRNGNQPTWASGTHGRADRLAWQSDGNLVIYMGNRAVWATGTADSQRGGQGGRTLTLGADGLLSIANAAGRMVWSGR